MATMDHFNATVHNGSLVSTRRGLHISKTKHQGTRFINAFAAQSSPPAAKPGTSSFSAKPASSATAQAQQPAAAYKGKFRHTSKANTRARRTADDKTTLPTRPAVGATTHTFQVHNIDADAYIEKKEEEEDSDAATLIRSSASQASSSPEQAYLSPEEFLAVSPASTYMLKQWQTHRCRDGMPEQSSQLMHMYMREAPVMLYADDELMSWNPTRDSRFFDRMNSDPATMHSIVMTGTLIGFVKRSIQNAFLEQQITNLCRIVNLRLQNQSKKLDLALVEAITAMAAAAVLMNQTDHWHLHMKGLRQVLAQIGGLSPDWGHVLAKIWKADVRGAAYSASLPYIVSPRFFAKASDKLPLPLATSLVNDLQRALKHTHLAPVTVDAMRALVLYTQTLHFARHAPKGAFLLDPNEYAQDTYLVEMQFVQYPDALGETVRSSVGSGFVLDTLDESSPRSDGQEESPCCTKPLPVMSNSLNSIVRIAGIMYVEECSTNPHGVNPYSALFSIFNTHMREILSKLHTRRFPIPDGSPAASDDLPAMDRLAPCLVWASVICYTVLNHVTFSYTYRIDDFYRAPYLDCIAFMVEENGGRVDELPESYFELCRLLPLQHLRGVRQDERAMLSRMMAESTTHIYNHELTPESTHGV